MHWEIQTCETTSNDWLQGQEFSLSHPSQDDERSWISRLANHGRVLSQNQRAWKLAACIAPQKQHPWKTDIWKSASRQFPAQSFCLFNELNFCFFLCEIGSCALKISCWNGSSVQCTIIAWHPLLCSGSAIKTHSGMKSYHQSGGDSLCTEILKVRINTFGDSIQVFASWGRGSFCLPFGIFLW